MLDVPAKSNGMCDQRKKLRLDFAPFPRIGQVMDDDPIDLIVRLGTRIGIVMEDASAVALTLRKETSLALPVKFGSSRTIALRCNRQDHGPGSRPRAIAIGERLWEPPGCFEKISSESMGHGGDGGIRTEATID